MKTIGQIINNINSYAVQQMKTIYKIWYSSIDTVFNNDTFSKEIHLKTKPYEYNAETKVLTVYVYDNMLHSDIKYMEEDFISVIAENGLMLNKINFKHTPRYEKLENNKNTYYTISKRAEDYINYTSAKLENKHMKESIKQFLTSYFHRNNFDEWILKG